MMSKITNETEWRKLYELAAQIKKLAPWELLAEDTLIGVEDPETGQLGVVSVMGMQGEHYALHIYLGERGFGEFWSIQELTSLNPLIVNDRLLQIPQLQLSFEDRDLLEKEDRDLIKKLGLKFRGRNDWPLFRKQEPGYVAWFLEPGDLPFFITVLEQTLEVLTKYANKLDKLDHDELDHLLVRVAKKRGDKLVWKEEWRKIGEFAEVLKIEFPAETVLAQIKQLPVQYDVLEMDMLLIPTPIFEKTVTPRPFYPYLALIVDQKSGMILGQNMGYPLPNSERLFGQLPLVLCDFFLRGQFRCKTIWFRNHKFATIVEPFLAQLGIKTKFVEDLRRAEAVFLSVVSMMGIQFDDDDFGDEDNEFLSPRFLDGPEA